MSYDMIYYGILFMIIGGVIAGYYVDKYDINLPFI